VPAGDVAQLTKAMADIIQHPQLRQEMIARGHQHAQRFTPQTFAEGVMAVYERAVG
jgi:glycosyltransferase involved in cell wall biosynthesis